MIPPDAESIPVGLCSHAEVLEECHWSFEQFQHSLVPTTKPCKLKTINHKTTQRNKRNIENVELLQRPQVAHTLC